MADDDQYGEGMERSVKYIPWKGKKSERFAWNNTFLVRAMTRGYYEILMGEETVKTNEKASLINEKLADQGITKLTTQEKKI